MDYCHGADERDLDRFLGVWHADATWDVGGPTFTGHAEIRWGIERQWESLTQAHHWTTGLTIDVDGDRARGRSTAHALTCGVGGVWRLSVGEYVDVYERRHGAWLIARRAATITSSVELAPRAGRPEQPGEGPGG